jgi:chromosome segregation ATPase
MATWSDYLPILTALGAGGIGLEVTKHVRGSKRLEEAQKILDTGREMSTDEATIAAKIRDELRGDINGFKNEIRELKIEIKGLEAELQSAQDRYWKLYSEHVTLKAQYTVMKTTVADLRRTVDNTITLDDPVEGEPTTEDTE